MDFIDEYGCEDWVEAFTKAIISHVCPFAEKILVEDMDEHYIYLGVKDLGGLSRKAEEKKFLLRYLDDTETPNNLLFFYILYLVQDGYMERRDYGAYEIVRCSDLIKCYRLDD